MAPIGSPSRSSIRLPSVAIGFVSGMVAGLPRAGLLVEPLLNRAEIAISLLRQDHARVPVVAYARLYRLINEQLDDEGFALFSRPLRRGTFEFLCRAALSAPTLDDALVRIARYLRVVLDDVEVTLLRTGDEAVIVLREVRALAVGAAGRVFAYEWLLRMIHGLAAWLVAHPLPLDEVDFPYPAPGHAPDYELVFAPRCRFDAAQLEARFPAEYLALPVRRDEAALRAFLLEAPASITTLYRRDRALALRVREHIRARLPENVSLPELARRLFLSPRTLHRQLDLEGTSFRAIREALRRDMALESVAKSSQPLNRIAADLGYADVASFYRAFSLWTGCGPREYRKRLAGTASAR